MAIREIRLDGDPLLRKKSRKVENVDDRIKELLEDMLDTMYEADGVGLAAPQVGVLRRIIVVDDGNGPLKMINPVILEKDEEIKGVEGCLSVPNRSGLVMRPKNIRVEYLDEDGQKQEIRAENLLARIICHEIDHLNGILYIDKMVEELFLEEEN